MFEPLIKLNSYGVFCLTLEPIYTQFLTSVLKDAPVKEYANSYGLRIDPIIVFV